MKKTRLKLKTSSSKHKITEIKYNYNITNNNNNYSKQIHQIQTKQTNKQINILTSKHNKIIL